MEEQAQREDEWGVGRGQEEEQARLKTVASVDSHRLTLTRTGFC